MNDNFALFIKLITEFSLFYFNKILIFFTSQTFLKFINFFKTLNIMIYLLNVSITSAQIIIKISLCLKRLFKNF